MDSLKVTLSQHFLNELVMTEVDPYRGDHGECTDDGVIWCDLKGGVHPVGDGWQLAVLVIEEAYDRAWKGSMKRVKVEIPNAAVCAIISMLVSDIDRWQDWGFEALAYIKAGGNLLAKARDYRDENNLTPEPGWFS